LAGSKSTFRKLGEKVEQKLRGFEQNNAEKYKKVDKYFALLF
jgi:hypothetical protein